MAKDIKEKIKEFPKTPGVYLMKNSRGKIIYIGKAGSLKTRVSSYFNRPHEVRIEKLVSEIVDIEYQKTPTVIEALVLEANLIKKYLPKYNVREKDNKSFLYLAITKEKFPRLFFIRGFELSDFYKKNKEIKINKLFGPYTSATSLRTALDAILRKIFPYRDCVIFPKRPCLQHQLKRCGAPCAELISEKEYKKNIKNLILFFEGKKDRIIKNLEKEMKAYSKENNFEKAAKVRNQIFALNHIQDVALLKKEQSKIIIKERGINVFGRIEGYDISNISGQSATGSMVVFYNGEPSKNQYRKFKIKTIEGPNDYGMLEEVLERRLKRAKKKDKKWPLPELILIDGGKGQANLAQKVLRRYKLKIPVMGIAKGFNRRQDRLVYDKDNLEIERVAKEHKDMLVKVRDEAHRFAVSYHKVLRKRNMLK